VSEVGFSLTDSLGVVYSDAFQQYDFGPGHPLRPTRLKLTFELMKAIGLLSNPGVRVFEPREATTDELRLFHKDDYLTLVRRMSRSGTGYFDMGDTPAFKGCYEASALATGGSLMAVDLVMSGQVSHAMNIAGGLHHAHPSRASGFCIFNDPAVSIALLKAKYRLERVLYVDVDAHHGDGVMYGFYSDPGVLDIDFHEDGRHLFPGTGFTKEIGEGKGSGFKVNFPLPPFSGDDIYVRAFKEIVPAAVRRYHPQMMLLQCGADSHEGDLLAHLQLTTRTYREVASTLHSLAHELAGGRLVVFGGGGYNMANVARTWTVVASTLAAYDYPTKIPSGWQKLFEALVGEKAPADLDSDQEAKSELAASVSWDAASVTLKDLKSRLQILS